MVIIVFSVAIVAVGSLFTCINNDSIFTLVVFYPTQEDVYGLARMEFIRRTAKATELLNLS